MPDAIAWLDAIDPQRAVRACGTKMGRLAELLPVGVRVPQGFAVTADAYRRHCAKMGLDEVIGAALGGLDPDAEAAGVKTAAQAVQAELTNREMDADLAGLITGAYEELSFRCLGINVPVAVRSSAIGEDSATASFAGIFDTYLGVCGGDLVLEAVRRCWASLFSAHAVAYRLRADLHHWDMPMAVGVLELIQAQASGCDQDRACTLYKAGVAESLSGVATVARRHGSFRLICGQAETRFPSVSTDSTAAG